MPFSLIPFALLVIPLMEIAVFVVVGGQIGVLATLALVVVTAIGGSILLRIQGFGLVNRIQADMNAGRVPARELVHGVMILVAGVLLLTPGFVTDAAGFALFVPFIRDTVWGFARSRIRVVTPHDTGTPRGSDRGDGGPTIDLSEDDYARDPDPDSPWGEDEPPARR
ncbi:MULTISPECIES: FxsA family protein [unclassified Roseitalea]|uniref:FxsA family protein n=1 Tax=unclassified Roseitalea TaxID=2639107 RepID=UPI00273F57F0|nr:MULTISPECIES: FxsA family protein [unclassified Roseitalea]